MRTLCKDCEFCVIVESDAVDQGGNKTGKKVESGFCHLNPPLMTGPMSTAFPVVAVEADSPATQNYWCAHGSPRITRKEKGRVHRKG